MQWNRWGYVVCIFGSAFLLFLIQPQLTKALLPVLGGSPVVWNAAVLCFQLLLLAGYGYVWWLSRPGRRWVRWHAVLLALSLLWLPLAVRSPALEAHAYPVLWVVLTLLSTIGLPFLLLSTNGPLMQMAYARSGLPGSQNPYPLYSASNLGSLLALMAYPLLLEMFWPLEWQASFWTAGYAAFVLLLGWVLWQQRRIPVAEAAAVADEPGPGWRMRAYWVFLAFIPSGLMLAVTTHITTDIAVAPLLWVIPLALYLLTLIQVFAARWRFGPKKLAAIRLGVILLLASLMIQKYMLLNVVWHLMGFYVIALGCHARLAQARPGAARLTEYYWWMAVGGALGGVLNAIIAPLWLDSVLEYPLLLILGVIVIFQTSPAMPTYGDKLRFVLAGILPVLLLQFALEPVAMKPVQALARLTDMPMIFAWYATVALALILAACWQGNRSFALMTGLIILMVTTNRQADIIYQSRNFFGVLKVQELQNGTKILMHGATFHGIQPKTGPYDMPVMTAYYREAAPAIRRLVPEHLQRSPMGIVGLGVGTLACLAHVDQSVDFYEIDPEMVRVAQQQFDYLSRCPGYNRIIVGDARMKLQETPPASYGLLFLDAYSSDAMPFHLLTKEAAEIYRSTLKPGGILAFHISHRYFNLGPVVVALADALGWHSYFGIFANRGHYSSVSVWVVMSEQPLSPEVMRDDWYSLDGTPRLLWTDSYSSLLRLLK